MRVIIVSGLVLTVAASLIIVDLGRRLIDCREAAHRFEASIKTNYWLIRKEP